MHSCQNIEENICFSNGVTNLHIHTIAQCRPEDNQVVNPPKNLVLNKMRGYSCETQLLATVEDIQRGIDSSSYRYDLVILDFTKAFDKVSFTRLIFKWE